MRAISTNIIPSGVHVDSYCRMEYGKQRDFDGVDVIGAVATKGAK